MPSCSHIKEANFLLRSITLFSIFSGKKKNPSMYRRPSELGLSTQKMEDKSEVRRETGGHEDMIMICIVR